MPQIRFGIFRQSMKNLGQIGRFDSKIFRLFSLDRHCAIRSKMASEIAKTFEHFDLFLDVLNPCYVTRQFKVRKWCIGNYNVPSKSPIQLCAAPFFCLGWQILGGGDSWTVKSPGMGKEKEGKWPVLRQHCNIFHWSHSRVAAILMCDLLIQLKSFFVIVLF